MEWLRWRYERVDDEGGDALIARRPRISRLAVSSLRFIVFGFLLVGALLCILDMVGSYILDKMDLHAELQRSALRHPVGLWHVENVDNLDDSPYPNEISCPQDGRVCICAHGFKPDGLNEHGEVKFKKNEDFSACQPWHFEVGDVLAFERPTGGDQDRLFTSAKVVSTVTNSPIVHVGIVTQVPPRGMNQTGENVVVTEAVKGDWKKVVQNPLRYVIQRWPFGGFWIRRVDSKRFPKFKKHKDDIKRFANARVGEPFDKHMLVPIKRRWTTGRRYVEVDPGCAERKRAYKMYKEGGPGKWICSMFVSWVLAFAGGLNLDYDPSNGTDTCELPPWVITNIQQVPGEVLRDDIFDPKITWKLPCGELGCYVAVPFTPDWAGGTLVRTSTSTTTTTARMNEKQKYKRASTAKHEKRKETTASTAKHEKRSETAKHEKHSEERDGSTAKHDKRSETGKREKHSEDRDGSTAEHEKRSEIAKREKHSEERNVSTAEHEKRSETAKREKHSEERDGSTAEHEKRSEEREGTTHREHSDRGEHKSEAGDDQVVTRKSKAGRDRVDTTKWKVVTVRGETALEESQESKSESSSGHRADDDSSSADHGPHYPTDHEAAREAISKESSPQEMEQ